MLALAYIPIFFIERSETVRQYLERNMTVILEDLVQGQGHVKLDNFSIVFPRAYIKEILLNSHTPGEWSIKGNYVTVTFSWLNFLFKRMINGDIHARSVDTSSQIVDNALYIKKPLVLLFSQGEMTIPFDCRSLKINEGRMIVNNLDLSDISSFKWSSFTTKEIGGIKSVASLYNCEFFFHHKHICHNGHMLVYAKYLDNGPMSAEVTGQYSTPLLLNKKNKINVTAKIHNNRGTYTLKDRKNKFDLHGLVELNDTTTSADICGTLAPKLLETALPFHLPFSIEGDGTVQAHATLSGDSIDYTGQYKLDNLSFGNIRLLDKMIVDFTATPKTNIGSINLYNNEQDKLVHGSWKFETNEDHGAFQLCNIRTVSKCNWNILPNQLLVYGNFSAKDGLSGSIAAPTQHAITKSKSQVCGSFSCSANDCLMNGNIGSYVIDAHTTLSQFSIDHIKVTNQESKQEVAKITTHDKKVNSAIDYSILHSFLPEELQSIFSGDGRFTYTGKLNKGIVTGNLCLNKGSIFLGHTANLISQISADVNIDFNKSYVTIPTGACKLHKGTISIKNGYISYKDSLWPLSSSLPLTINGLFVGWQKMAGIFSGNIILSSNGKEPPSLSGTMSIDQALLNNNILSGRLRKEVSHLFHQSTQIESPLMLDVTLQSKEPITIQTDLLSTKALVDLTIKNSSINPNISGSIDLQGGWIAFPYKKLNIRQGSIHFLPEQPYNPLIEIIAKNTIKDYKITLYVTGSTQDPTINLESTPTLTDEQIGSLLMSGSEDISWSILMPTLLAPYIKTFITGNKTSQKLASKRFSQTILKPLRHIRLIPIFTDQTGRDGFRTALEIKASDRLHARIERSFTITEDTAFEIDYALTDDVHARIIKNELGDLGGEIEMRWKF
ncbi:MAG TPA: translocation/assembly module TamB domain-containing protein [Candidatus Babeliales bacterium]|nr:translocation/assembly module TamB domain-containing protein [Candidatus Babeliales bacterium]